MSFTSWQQFISQHPDRENLNSKMETVSNLIESGDSGLKGFKALSSSPSTILLTYDRIPNQVIPSYFHSVLGNEILDENVTLMGLNGFDEKVNPLIFDSSLFSSFKSESITPPDWDDLFNLGAMAEHSSVKSKSPLEYKKFAIIPPLLAPAVMIEDPTPARVLANMISILSDYSSEILSGDSVQVLDENDLKKKFEQDLKDTFHQTFLFLWAATHAPFQSRFSPVSSPGFNNKDVIRKSNELNSIWIKSNDPNRPSLELHRSFSIEQVEPMVQAAVQAAVKATNDVSTRMSLADEEKVKPLEKGFKNLPDYTRKFLCAVASNGVDIPSLPSKECLEILNAKTGPSVVSLFKQWYPTEDFQLNRGMAHNLGHGNILSSHPSIIDNVSIFFTPPSQVVFALQSHRMNSIHCHF